MAAGNGFLRDGHNTDDSGSDSDADQGAYYHPISADSDDAGDASAFLSNAHQNGNPNPYFMHHHAENGIADLDLDSDGGDVGSEEEEGEQEKENEASISRAFSEDESRRSAPLTAENAARVLEAMRGVMFQGAVPDWAREVPEESWVDRLRRLRGEPSPQS